MINSIDKFMVLVIVLGFLGLGIYTFTRTDTPKELTACSTYIVTDRDTFVNPDECWVVKNCPEESYESLFRSTNMNECVGYLEGVELYE